MDPSLAKLKVLVVDDNQHMTNIVKTHSTRSVASPSTSS